MKKFVFCLVFISTFFSGFSQDFEKLLANYNRQNPQEHIYIDFDRDHYAPGETVWLKAYFYQNGRPSLASSNFFLQLLNSRGEVIEQKLYPVSGASAKGNIDLSDSIADGTYFIRAGTPTMLQAGESGLYSKALYVTSTGTIARGNPGDISLMFAPESGHLVDGILTTIAFKAVDAAGWPVDVAGKIRSSDGIDIPFQSFRNGIGKFQLRPKNGQTYTAELNVKGKTSTYPLPPVEASGINLKVQEEKGGKLFQLSRSEKDKGQYEMLNLVVTLNNTVVYDNRISFDGYPSVKGHLLTDSLSSGILYFTVFDDKMVKLAERLAFVNNGEYRARPEINILSKGPGKREPNNLQVQFADATPTSLSIAVIDAARQQSVDKENIFSRLLLTSYLNPHVFNAASYFENNDDSTRQALDNLLLTQSWAGFRWDDVVAAKQLAPQAEKYLMMISGLVKDAKDNRVLPGGSLNIFLESGDSMPQSFVVPVSASGRFVIDSLYFSGDGRFYYEYITAQGKAKAATVALENSSVNKNWFAVSDKWLQSLKSLPVSISAPNYVKEQKTIPITANAGELQQVVLQTKKARPADVVNETYATGFFKSMGKIVIDNINQPFTPGQTSVVDYITQNVRTLKLDGSRFVNLKNFSMNTGKNWEIGAFLNESISTVATLKQIRMDEVAMIKFYEAGFPGAGMTSPGGAVVVYMKTNGERPKQQQSSEAFFTAAGYSVAKEFHSPDYSSAGQNHTGADTRPTLYWNPAIFTSSDKPAVEIKFFNNDVSKSFRIILEGFDGNGKLIHLEKTVN